MKKVIAFTNAAKQEETKRVNKWLEILEQEYSILNIPQFRVEDHVKPGVTVITFGAFLERAVTQYIESKEVSGVRVIKLPNLQRLEMKDGNVQSREKAMAQLFDLKELLKEEIFQPLEIIITDKDLPDLDRRHLAMLQKLTEETGKTSCFQVSKNGKVIEIGEKNNDKADIHVSFEEIYTIRQTMDVLGVNEVRLVKHNEKTNNK